jgi:hypothetical protein
VELRDWSFGEGSQTLRRDWSFGEGSQTLRAVLHDVMQLLDKKDALLEEALAELKRLADDQAGFSEEELGDLARVDLSVIEKLDRHLSNDER